MSDAGSLQTIKALLDGQSQTAAAQWAGLRYELEARFDAVDSRLSAIDEKQRIANGRVTKMEGSLERLDERVGGLQDVSGEHDSKLDEIDRRSVQRRAEDRASEFSITRRDVAMFVLGGGSIVAVIRAAVWVFHEIKGLL